MDMSHEACVAKGKIGGKKSGEVRRANRYFKHEIEKQLGCNLEEAITALWRKAKQGDVQALIFLRDTIGEKPSDKIENEVKMSVEQYLGEVEEDSEY